MTVDDVARERASSAHRRLDGYNGQIARLGDEVSETREGLYAAIGTLHDRQNDTNIELAKVKTRAGIMAAIGAALATCVVAPLLVYVLVSLLHLNQPQAQQKPQASVAVVRAAR